jgi:hypothetical protein
MVSICVSGDYAYTARYDGLVEIINVSDPEQPQLAGSILLPDHVQGVDGKILVSDSLAFVLAWQHIFVINISNPSAPALVATWDYYGGTDMIISGYYAYLASGNYFQVLNISNIQAPVLLSSLYGQLDGICMNGSVVYGVHASSYGNLRIIDVTNPLEPLMLSDDLNLPIYGNSDIGYANEHVYMVSSTDLWAIDVSDPYNPVPVDTMFVVDFSNKIFINNNKAYINNDGSGIGVLDISDPPHPIFLGYYDTPGHCEQVVSENDIAYSATAYSGLQVIDVSDPVNPWMNGTVNAWHIAQGIDIKDDYAYMNDGYGLDVIDVSDVTNPVKTENYFGGYGFSDDVSIHGNRLVFTQKYQYPRLNFVDISVPGQPVLRHYDDVCNGWSYYYGSFPVDQDDDHVFVGTGDSLLIYDIADFSNPVQVAVYFAPGDINDVLVDNDMLYISTVDYGIEIISIDHIESPQLKGTFNTSGNAGELALKQNTLIVADGPGGICFIDISDPENPVFINTVMPHPNSNIIANPVIIGNQLVVADKEWNEIFTYDISDFNDIQLIKSLRINAEIYRFVFNADMFFCSVNWYGMMILDSSPILSVTEEGADPQINSNIKIWPNPFKSSTNIEYGLTNKSKVVVEIINQAGVKVRTLKNGIENPGMHLLTWDGTDNNLNRVSPGVYYVKISRNNRIDCSKVILTL